MNANVTAICACGHNFKVEPYGEGLEDGREFDAACANCGASETFFLFSLAGLQDHDLGISKANK